MNKINSILNSKEKSLFTVLIFVSLVSSFVQSIGIASFFPFMNMALDLSVIHSNNYYNSAYKMVKFNNPKEFVIVFGIVVGILILLSSFFNIFTSWFRNKFVLMCTHSVSKRLMNKYLNMPYDFILNHNSSELAKHVLSDVNEFTNNYLSSVIELINSILMITFIVAMLMLVNVKTTIIIILFFIIIYGGVMLFSKAKLKSSGQKVLNAALEKHKLTNEAFYSFKILKSYGCEEFFLDKYNRSSKKVAKYQLISKLLSEIPKHFIEALIFIALTVFITLMVFQNRKIDVLLPSLSVYALSGYRIMPQIARTFASLSSIYHTKPILDTVYKETLGAFKVAQKEQGLEININNTDIVFNESIKLSDVSFKYNQNQQLFENLNLEIKANSTIGFAGTTGSGKTTLVDLIMGLLTPSNGNLIVDDQVINTLNVKNWQKKVGYVPQDVNLIDDTLRANIAFGIEESSIDDLQIKRVSEIASISEFIELKMIDKYNSKVGERGIKLSGGQRQRIGLARALYRNPMVLILDEATSALDGVTEEAVVNSIHNKSKVRTIIIIAHRLNTLKQCDLIYLLENGKIIDSGKYDDLIKNNQKFRLMAKQDINN